MGSEKRLLILFKSLTSLPSSKERLSQIPTFDRVNNLLHRFCSVGVAVLLLFVLE